MEDTSSNAKTRPYELYVWCPALSPHVLPLIYAAHDHPRFSRAVYVGQKASEPARQKLGWEVDIREDADIVTAPDEATVERLVRDSSPDAIHIFYGMRRVPCIVNGLKAAIKHGRRFGIYSEPRVLEGPAGLLRLLQSLFTEGDLRRNADFVLAIGAHGPRWFRSTGYVSRQIFRAAYFLDLRKKHATISIRPENPIVPTIAFLGRHEQLKGFHLFLKSLPLIRNNVKVVSAGSGTLSDSAITLSKTTQNFQHLGVIPMSEVAQFLARVDILVLPSITTDDGWGAVVSEALMAGAAVITTSKVGASVCLGSIERGLVIDSGSAGAIASAVDWLIDEHLLTAHYRRLRSHWAAAHLDQEAGINYLVRIFDHLYGDAERPSDFVGA